MLYLLDEEKSAVLKNNFVIQNISHIFNYFLKYFYYIFSYYLEWACVYPQCNARTILMT